MPADTTIQALENPTVPYYDPLTQASVPQPDAQIVTTAAVNGNNGSVDNGGPIDKIAAAAANDRFAAANAWSQQTFGMPLAVPSIAGIIARGSAMLLGAFIGGYHGYKRSGGRGFSTVGYGLAGALFPIPTLGVGLVQGYAKPRRR